MHHSPTVTAIDGRPANPAMAAALAAIDASVRVRQLRADAINADPRVIRLRAMKERTVVGYGFIGAAQVFAAMGDGTLARRSRIAALVRARTGQLDRNIFAIRDNLGEAATIRRQGSRLAPINPIGLTAGDVGRAA